SVQMIPKDKFPGEMAPESFRAGDVLAVSWFGAFSADGQDVLFHCHVDLLGVDPWQVELSVKSGVVLPSLHWHWVDRFGAELGVESSLYQAVEIAKYLGLHHLNSFLSGVTLYDAAIHFPLDLCLTM